MKAEKIIVPISGGKDSQVTLIMAMQDGRAVIPVFNNTGWDHPLTYEHLQYIMDFFGLKLNETFCKETPTMPDLIRKYKKFPFGKGRFCTRDLKQMSFKWWVDTIEGTAEIWLGIRLNESVQRREKYNLFTANELFEMDELFPGTYPKRIKERMCYRLPVLYFTEQKIFKFIRDSGMKPNPLYKMGDDRVGCYPCLLAGKKNQERNFNTEFGQQQWKIIKGLEEELGIKYKYQAEDLTCEACKI